MIRKNKTIYVVVVGMVSLVYLVWRFLLPTEIVDVHTEDYFKNIVVKNLPITAKGQIKWWLKNEEMLKRRYNMPKLSSDGTFALTIWDIGKGYMKGNPDNERCYESMKTKENCIEKGRRFSVEKTTNASLIFIANSKYYRWQKNSKLVRIR